MKANTVEEVAEYIRYFFPRSIIDDPKLSQFLIRRAMSNLSCRFKINDVRVETARQFESNQPIDIHKYIRR